MPITGGGSTPGVETKFWHGLITTSEVTVYTVADGGIEFLDTLVVTVAISGNVSVNIVPAAGSATLANALLSDLPHALGTHIYPIRQRMDPGDQIVVVAEKLNSAAASFSGTIR